MSHAALLLKHDQGYYIVATTPPLICRPHRLFPRGNLDLFHPSLPVRKGCTSEELAHGRPVDFGKVRVCGNRESSSIVKRERNSTGALLTWSTVHVRSHPRRIISLPSLEPPSIQSVGSRQGQKRPSPTRGSVDRSGG